MRGGMRSWMKDRVLKKERLGKGQEGQEAYEARGEAAGRSTRKVN